MLRQFKKENQNTLVCSLFTLTFYSSISMISTVSIAVCTISSIFSTSFLLNDGSRSGSALLPDVLQRRSCSSLHMEEWKFHKFRSSLKYLRYPACQSRSTDGIPAWYAHIHWLLPDFALSVACNLSDTLSCDQSKALILLCKDLCMHHITTHDDR